MHITTSNIHPVPGRDSSCCTTTGGGTWIDKIIHFRPDRPPSSAGDEIQTEYFIPVEKLGDAMNDLYKIKKNFEHLV